MTLMLKSLTTRSEEDEMLDAPFIQQGLLFRNLKELDIINKRLGGHTATLAGLSRLIKDKSKTYRIADLGCGGGDTLLAIAKWAGQNQIKVQLLGIDKNPDAVIYACKACAAYSNISIVCNDFSNLDQYQAETDIVICALFCHHLYGDALDKLIQVMHKQSALGFVINDLHRHWAAYYSIKVLTRLLSASALVKNDAPLSVAKGFSKNELDALLLKNGVENYQLEWNWAFRWLVVGNTSLNYKSAH